MEKHNPGRQLVSMAEGIKEATNAFLQRGEKTRIRIPNHPSPGRDMVFVYNNMGCRKRKMSNTKGVATTAVATTAATTTRPFPVKESNKIYKLKDQQRANAWRSHQSKYHKERRRCHWEMCLGIALSKSEGAKRGQARQTWIHCEECSLHKGQTVYQ